MTRGQQLSPIDVTSLGSYVFCPRAGVIAYKQQGLQFDSEEEPRIPNMGYLPDFSVEELRERFEVVYPPFLRYTTGFCIGLILVWLVARFGSASLSFLLLLAILPIGWKAMVDGLALLAIIAELARYKQARPAILDPSVTKPIQVTWYELVKADYKPIKLRGRLEDQELNVTGHPWRILQTTDAVRIPVFNYSGGNFRIRESQVLRLAMYSHLCKVCMRGSKSEWGILLDVESKRCFAIPINDELRLKAILERESFEKVLDADREHKKVATPVGSPCQNCRYGKPRPFVQGESETVFNSGPIGAFTQRGPNGQLLHSDCGDEFEWLPPHRFWQTSEEL